MLGESPREGEGHRHPLDPLRAEQRGQTPAAALDGGADLGGGGATEMIARRDRALERQHRVDVLIDRRRMGAQLRER